jgi:serpin B
MGKTTKLDFSNAQEAADQINAWIEEQTNEKIKDMLQSSDIHPLTKMILCNAIYFKGDWKYQFDQDQTIEEQFYNTPDSSISVPMMSLNDEKITFNYTEDDDVQILELPYKGENLSMILLLPKENNVSSLENQLSWSKIDEWLQSMSEQSVNIKIPKFTFETEYSLKETLQSMGMQDPFSMDADFSGIDGRKDLFIDKVLHNAFIQVDETGTEAAAATTVHIALTSIPPSNIEFHADHPFLFLIQQTQTGNILFLGKVTHPQ